MVKKQNPDRRSKDKGEKKSKGTEAMTKCRLQGMAADRGNHERNRFRLPRQN
jgi:hypothetical protein